MSRGDSDGATGIRLSFEAMLGKLNDTLGGVASALDRIHKLATPNPIQTPLPRTVLGATAAAATALTYTFMDCGGPPAGFRREIRWFAVWGSPDIFLTLSGVNVIALIAQPNQYADNNTEPNFTQSLAMPAAVPNRFSATHNEVSFEYPLHLILCFKGLANSQQVNAHGQAWDWDVSSRQSEPL